MEYEYSIQCVCGSTSSGGGFTSPVNLDNAEVLSRTWHNGGCPVSDANTDPNSIIIANEQDSNVMRYVISINQ